jgi:hypothetical protein
VVRFWLALLGFAIALTFFCVQKAEADHNTFLPLVPNTPIMRQITQAQEYTWCADARASSYPNFLTQLRDVNNQYTERVGIRHREVSFSDSGCQLRHTMPDNHGCSGCAAWVYYANSPVLIEYKWQLGYQDWRSTIGHELGHALLGLHEQYRDSGGSIACTGQQWTVMDCGSGVRYPQPWDVVNGCYLIATSWCGNPPPPPQEWCCDTTYPGWDPTVSRLHVPTATWYWGVPDFRPVEQLWYWQGNGPWECSSGCP